MNITQQYLNGSYNTDKYNLGYMENFYDNEFSKIQDTCENFLEIGCWQGESIKLWQDYFTDKTNIIGIDINDFPSSGITKIIDDGYSEKIVNKFDDNFFDVVLDDGPHTYQSFLDVMLKYFPKIKPGGILIIEDIIRPWLNMGVTEEQQSYLKTYAKEIGYTLIEEYDMTKKQKTPQLYQKWKTGLFILKLTK
tara:strand:- start:123 stop:701 length:579 start_codon:yes stop_codon:yes gene_type:complete